jgi:hypothetical protein
MELFAPRAAVRIHTYPGPPAAAAAAASSHPSSSYLLNEKDYYAGGGTLADEPAPLGASASCSASSAAAAALPLLDRARTRLLCLEAAATARRRLGLRLPSLSYEPPLASTTAAAAAGVIRISNISSSGGGGGGGGGGMSRITLWGLRRSLGQVAEVLDSLGPYCAALALRAFLDPNRKRVIEPEAPEGSKEGGGEGEGAGAELPATAAPVPVPSSSPAGQHNGNSSLGLPPATLFTESAREHGGCFIDPERDAKRRLETLYLLGRDLEGKVPPELLRTVPSARRHLPAAALLGFEYKHLYKRGRSHQRDSGGGTAPGGYELGALGGRLVAALEAPEDR